jgi:hypothetical protein
MLCWGTKDLTRDILYLSLLNVVLAYNLKVALVVTNYPLVEWWGREETIEAGGRANEGCGSAATQHSTFYISMVQPSWTKCIYILEVLCFKCLCTLYSCIVVWVWMCTRKILFWEVTGKERPAGRAKRSWGAGHPNNVVSHSELPLSCNWKQLLKYMFLVSTCHWKMETVEIWSVETWNINIVERKRHWNRVNCRPCSSFPVAPISLSHKNQQLIFKHCLSWRCLCLRETPLFSPRPDSPKESQTT